MQKVFNKILSCGLAVALCLGITAVVHGTSSIVTDAETDYYAPITETGGNALLGQIHDLITTTHERYTSYADCKTYGPTTDPGLDGTGALEFYTHETLASFVDGNNSPGMWNREHVWAQSLSKQPSGGQLWGTNGGGSDLHHLRPSEVKLNAARGNYRYGEVKNGSATYSKTTTGADSLVGGYIGTSENGSGTAFEPLENVKGDVARIVMYVYTHYNTYQNVGGKTNGSADNMGYFGTLKLTQIISANTESEAIELLLAWNKSDPVDRIERTRNEEAYKLQKNRNAFIDHPEYADAIWGKGAVKPGDDVGGGDVGGEVDEAKLGAFHTAVAGIKTEGTLAERLASLNAAIGAYKVLSSAEKAQAATDVEVLQAAITAYNEAAKAYNQEFDKANKGALSGAGGLFR